MKTSLMSLAAFFVAVLLMAGTQGCYTQFSASHETPVYDNDAAEAPAPADTDEEVAGEDQEAGTEVQPQNDYGQDWTCQMHMGFDGYYPSTYWPSVGFSFAYNSPYYGWYDPWYSYGYPYYGYGYGYGYPYYPYDPYYGYPYYGYPVEAVPWQNREFGSTRSGGNTRNARSTDAGYGSRGVTTSNGSRDAITTPLQQMDLPAGSARSVTGGTAAGTRTSGTSATTTEPSRTNGSSRKAVTRKMNQKLSPGQKGTKSTRDQRLIYRDRGSVSGSGNSRDTQTGPSLNSTPPSSGGASSRKGTSTKPSGGSQPPRSGGSSVRSAPPPSAAPAAAPRSGGSAPSGGSRSGGGGGGGGRRR